jgi:hypothetical protein
MLKGICSFFLSLICFIGTVFLLISVTGVTTSPSGLKKYPWIEAKSDGTIMAVGRIFGGSNAIFIEGEDSDVLKYVDCKDMFEFCKSCGSISSTTTFLVALTFLFGFVTMCLTWSSLCYESNTTRRAVASGITCLSGTITYAYFNKCSNAFRHSAGVTDVVSSSLGYESLLYGLILCTVVSVVTGVLKLIEEKTTWLNSRSRAVYAANADFEFDDVEENDPDFQANLDR